MKQFKLNLYIVLFLITANNCANLYTSVRTGNVEDTKIAIAKGDDVNAIGDGKSLLYSAILYPTLLDSRKVKESTEIARLLIEKGADVNAMNYDGERPLHIASLYGNVEIVKLLIDRGADVNCINPESETPLHKAARNGNIEIIKLLLAKKADKKIRDSSGKIPLDYAKTNELKALL